MSVSVSVSMPLCLSLCLSLSLARARLLPLQRAPLSQSSAGLATDFGSTGQRSTAHRSIMYTYVLVLQCRADVLR